MTVKVDAPLGSRKRRDQLKRYHAAVAKKQPGSVWRFLAHAKRRTERVALSSDDQPSVFDELVVDFGKDAIHIEMMDTRTWWIGIGDENRMLRIRRDGSIEIGEMYR